MKLQISNEMWRLQISNESWRLQIKLQDVIQLKAMSHRAVIGQGLMKSLYLGKSQRCMLCVTSPSCTVLFTPRLIMKNYAVVSGHHFKARYFFKACFMSRSLQAAKTKAGLDGLSMLLNVI